MIPDGPSIILDLLHFCYCVAESQLLVKAHYEAEVRNGVSVGKAVLQCFNGLLAYVWLLMISWEAILIAMRSELESFCLVQLTLAAG